MDPLILDQWLYETLSGIEERETNLTFNVGKRCGPALKIFDPGPDFGALHMTELARVLEHLANGLNPFEVSEATLGKLRRVVGLLLSRQGTRAPWYSAGYWLCVRSEALPGDAFVEFGVTFSTQVVAFLHRMLEWGSWHPKTRAKIEASLLAFFLAFCKNGFPAHGHDIDLDYERYARFLRLGGLQRFLASHAKVLPQFCKAAENLVLQEVMEGPVRSPFLQGNPDNGFSSMGDFCLETLAMAQSIGVLKRPRTMSNPRGARF